MASSREIFLALVRSALWRKPFEVDESMPDWTEILRLAEQQTVMGLVADSLRFLPESMRPSGEMYRKLQMKAVLIAQSHALLNMKLAQTVRFLESNGLNTVLFKGQGVALNYPDPITRQCGDIDLYVGEKSFQKALDLLKPDEQMDKYRYIKHFDYDDGGVHVEIHRIAEILPGWRKNRLFQQWTVRNLEQSSLRRVEIAGEMINLPPVNFDALYIMNHIWHHFVQGGIGLRQLCDWTMYLHKFHGDIDKDLLKADLHRFGLSEAWQILGCIAVEYLGLPPEELPLYTGEYKDKSDMILQIIWSEGNFGKYSKGATPRPVGYIQGKLHSFRRNSSRYGRLIPISPVYMMKAWASYMVTGILNVFNR